MYLLLVFCLFNQTWNDGSDSFYTLASYNQLLFLLIEMEAATPRGLARTEDPGLSFAREAAEVLPPESVCCNENQHFI